MVLMLAVTGAMANQQGGSYSRIDTNPPSVGIQVFDANNTEQLLTSIDWGMLNPGQTANHDALIVNNDASKTWNLTVTTSEWNPANATEYMAFTYEVYGETLQTQLAVRFTLEIYENATDITDFSFSITLNFQEASQ